MPAVIPRSIHVCRIRVTRLNNDGTVFYGSSSSYVSDAIDHLNWTSDIAQGDRKNVTDGCGCLVATSKTDDALQGFGLELEQNRLEPALLELLTGGTLITAGSPAVPVGMNFPVTVACGQRPKVAIEAWSDTWDSDAPMASPNRYIRWVFPGTTWVLGNGSLQNEFLLPTLQGATKGNSVWQLGPYGDQDHAVEEAGAFFWDDTIPAITSGAYAAVSSA